MNTSTWTRVAASVKRKKRWIRQADQVETYVHLDGLDKVDPNKRTLVQRFDKLKYMEYGRKNNIAIPYFVKLNEFILRMENDLKRETIDETAKQISNPTAHSSLT